MNRARKDEDGTINSVTEAIEAMQNESFLERFRPDNAAIGGDENEPASVWWSPRKRPDG